MARGKEEKYRETGLKHGRYFDVLNRAFIFPFLFSCTYLQDPYNYVVLAHLDAEKPRPVG